MTKDLNLLVTLLESTHHICLECHFASLVWDLCDMNVPPLPLDWAKGLRSIFDGKPLKSLKFVVMYWFLRSNRNKVVHESCCQTPFHLTLGVQVWMDGFQWVNSSHKNPPRIKHRMPLKWRVSANRVIKINVNAAWRKENYQVIVGLVGFDHHEHILLVISYGFPYSRFNLSYLEALMVLWGLKEALRRRFHRLLLESDS